MENKPCPVVPVAILVRVSTKRQETERQVHELHAVAAARGWQVVEVIEEDGVSGASREADRHGLARVETLAAAGTIKKVLVHEVSRVGRRPAAVHGFVERFIGAPQSGQTFATVLTSLPHFLHLVKAIGVSVLGVVGSGAHPPANLAQCLAKPQRPFWTERARLSPRAIRSGAALRKFS